MLLSTFYCSSSHPLCAACRWHRGMQIGTEFGRVIWIAISALQPSLMTPLSYPLRSTTLLSAFTLCFPWALLILSYPHSNYLFSLSSLSIRCLPPFFSLPIYSCTSSSCHLYLHFLILHSLAGLHFPFYSSHPCPLLSFLCQSFDYSSASQAVCINNTAPVAHMDRRRRE